LKVVNAKLMVLKDKDEASAVVWAELPEREQFESMLKK